MPEENSQQPDNAQDHERARPSGESEHDETQREEERQAEDETISDSSKCPECGAPVENLRATCPNCGHEYSDDDYDQPDAGTEFSAGTELDESGEEVVDESGKVSSEREDES